MLVTDTGTAPRTNTVGSSYDTRKQKEHLQDQGRRKGIETIMRQFTIIR